MYGPGEESVAERSHLYAEEIRAGVVEDPRLLFDHRQASERHDLATKSGLRAAITEASGDARAWLDLDGVAAQYLEAVANHDERAANQFRRYWLNQRRIIGGRAFSPDLWESRAARPPRELRPGADVVLAFDGSYARDSTALVGATVEETPHLFVLRSWERPAQQPGWRTPVGEVLDAVDAAMARYRVAELAPDPPGWHHEVEGWEHKYGDVVVRFETNQTTRMGPACDEFTQGLKDGEFSHDGDRNLARHVANCITAQRGKHIVVTKEHPDSPLKIDLAVGAVLAFVRARWHYRNPARKSLPPMVAVG
jgi:phage terminase large subunit-like protein